MDRSCKNKISPRKNRSDAVKTKHWFAFKKSIATYLRKVQSNNNTKLKKEKEELRKKLELKKTANPDQIEKAQKRFNEIQNYEDQGKIIRAKIKDLDSGIKLTKYHSIRIKKSYKKDTVKEMQDMNGIIHRDQESIGKCCVQYWSHIMRKRDINRHSMHNILNHVHL